MSLSQLSKLLPLPDPELKQVLDYAATLSKAEAADHFRNLLGESPECIDFIATFNSKRQDPRSSQASSGRNSSSGIEPVPKPSRAPKKEKAPLRTPAPRPVANLGFAPGVAYNKNAETDYMPGRSSPASTPSGSEPSKKNPPPKGPSPKPGPTTPGHLISDVRKPKPKPNNSNSSSNARSSTPVQKTKVHITGGTAMHGASTALSDLDNAISVLETTTNPTRDTDDAARRCNCIAARHPLLAAAPNCLNCGKVICVKEGLGPCTFCGTPLLSPAEVQAMIRELRTERGREKMAADRSMHKKADVSRTPAPFTKPRETPDSNQLSEAEAKALEHRDRLLNFQSQNARRTTVRDEAADFDVGAAVTGLSSNIWATPEDRARELKRQQKTLREMEWNARPEYEKRRQVVSIDVVKGKVVKKMAAIERPKSPVSDDERNQPRGEEEQEGKGKALGESSGNRTGGGAFSKNPLLGSLIRPVFEAKGKGAELEGRNPKASQWRRVQDDLENNEAVILDGGAYGGGGGGGRDAASLDVDEPGCG